MKTRKNLIIIVFSTFSILTLYFIWRYKERYNKWQKAKTELWLRIEEDRQAKFNSESIEIFNSINDHVIYLYNDSTKQKLNQVYKLEYKYPHPNGKFQVAMTKDTLSSSKKDTLKLWVIPDNGRLKEIENVQTEHFNTSGDKEELKPESKEPYFYLITSDKKGIGKITSHVTDRDGRVYSYTYKYVVK